MDLNCWARYRPPLPGSSLLFWLPLFSENRGDTYFNNFGWIYFHWLFWFVLNAPFIWVIFCLLENNLVICIALNLVSFVCFVISFTDLFVHTSLFGTYGMFVLMLLFVIGQVLWADGGDPIPGGGVFFTIPF